MPSFLPLIVNSGAAQIQELPAGDDLDLASSNIANAVNVTATGNVSGGNLVTAGVVSATGNVTGGNLTTAGVVTATGDVTGGNLTTAGLVSATGNVSGGNLTTTGVVTATGNVSGANLVLSGNIVDSGALSLVTASSGNVSLAPNGTNVLVVTTTGANITGTLNATGNANVGNLSIAGTLVGNSTIGIDAVSIANVQASLKVGTNARERITISATAAANTINYDVIDQGVLYYTANATSNWTINLRGNSTITLDQYLAAGESITVAFLATNGATAYYQNNFQINASNVTPKWQGASAPTGGAANNIDVYVINAIKTGANAFTVLESVTKFG